MSSHSVIWSASGCGAAGAGVYIGVAPQHEHMIVARALSKRQAKLFIGGHVVVPAETRPWQIYYYAVRDPSAVRIIPVERGQSPGGFRPAELRFRFAPSVDESVASPGPSTLSTRKNGVGGTQPAVFIVTIGLNSGADRSFFQRVVGEGSHEWADVFERVRGDLCSDAA